MNILLFVTSLLMVMASLTYTRLETYRNFSLTQNQFTLYMDQRERGSINLQAETLFTHSRGAQPPPQPPTPSDPNNPKPPSVGSNEQVKNTGKARSRLSLAMFIDSAKKNAHPKEYLQFFALARKLIYLLYNDQPFFQAMERKNPDFVHSLLKALMVADAFPKEKKIKKTKQLANLDLLDEDLNHVFYEMLQGTVKKIEPKQELNKKSDQLSLLTVQEKESKGEDDGEDVEEDTAEDQSSPKGYYSLKDFITLTDATKVRVFLAPKTLLQAIFDDPKVVDEIMAARLELYKKFSGRHSISKQDASKLFEDAFRNKSDPSFSDILDFTVTKTNPKAKAYQ